MENIPLILQYLTQGGSTAVIVLMAVVIGILIWDRKQLLKSLSETTQKVFDAKDSENKSIREIVDRYHEGNLGLVQALNEIKLVLTTIQNSKR
jgi:hypothetical protein